VRLTAFTDYGLRALMYLAISARRGEPCASVHTIAEALDVSPHHLAKVSQGLAQHGFVTARRGRDGGLVLVCDPAALTVGQVVRALEPSELVPCFESADACSLTPGCGLAGALAGAQEAFLRSLDAVTLADCVRKPKALVQLVARAR
jgi:Rrf2 family nitric oxide-sensitive transcriptional repressor